MTLVPAIFAMHKSTYVYQPLAHRHNRLLQVTQDQELQLKCKFVPISLDDSAVEYAAISYFWGSDALVSSLACDESG